MGISSYCLSICLILLTATISLCQENYGRCRVLKIKTASPNDIKAVTQLQETLGSNRFDIWSHISDSATTESLDVLVCPEVRGQVKQFLTANNLSWKTSVRDIGALIERERVSNRAKKPCRGKRCTTTLPPPTTTTESGDGSPHPIVGTYPTNEELSGFLDDAERDFPDIASVLSIGNSVESRDTRMIKLQMGSTSKPAVYLDSLTHAREWITVASVVHFIDRVLRGSEDPTSEEYWLLSTYDWYIVPIVNPDGYAYSYTRDRLWRKNRRQLSKRCYGVDLNRNYGYQWGLDSGSSGSYCSQIYRGPNAFSEPETANIRDFFTANPSIQWNFTLSIHSYSQLWLHPYGYAAIDAPDLAELQRVGTAAVDAIQNADGRVFQSLSGADLYLASGTTLDWQYGTLGIKYSYTSELRPASSDDGGFILPTSDIEPSGQELYNAIVDSLKAIAGTI